LDADCGGRLLYSPQYVAGGGYKSSVTLVNLEGAATQLLISWYGDDGRKIGSDRLLSLAGWGRVTLVDAASFGVAVPAEGLQGYLTIAGSSARISGTVRFGDTDETQFQTTLPLVAAGRPDALFTQAAQNETYYTGLAVVNPNGEVAQYTATIHGSDGSQVGSVSGTIVPNGRISRLLSQLVPSLAMNSGYFKISANVPIVSFAVFGTHARTALSAVPAQ